MTTFYYGQQAASAIYYGQTLVYKYDRTATLTIMPNEPILEDFIYLEGSEGVLYQIPRIGNQNLYSAEVPLGTYNYTHSDDSEYVYGIYHFPEASGWGYVLQGQFTVEKDTIVTPVFSSEQQYGTINVTYEGDAADEIQSMTVFQDAARMHMYNAAAYPLNQVEIGSEYSAADLDSGYIYSIRFNTEDEYNLDGSQEESAYISCPISKDKYNEFGYFNLTITANKKAGLVDTYLTLPEYLDQPEWITVIDSNGDEYVFRRYVDGPAGFYAELPAYNVYTFVPGQRFWDVEETGMNFFEELTGDFSIGAEPITIYPEFISYTGVPINITRDNASEEIEVYVNGSMITEDGSLAMCAYPNRDVLLEFVRPDSQNDYYHSIHAEWGHDGSSTDIMPNEQSASLTCSNVLDEDRSWSEIYVTITGHVDEIEVESSTVNIASNEHPLREANVDTDSTLQDIYGSFSFKRPYGSKVYLMQRAESYCNYKAYFSDGTIEYGNAELGDPGPGWYSSEIGGWYNLDPSVSTNEHTNAEVTNDQETNPNNVADAMAISFEVSDLLNYSRMSIYNNQEDTLLIDLLNVTEENLYTDGDKQYLLITQDIVNESDAEYILDFLGWGPLTATLRA